MKRSPLHRCLVVWALIVGNLAEQAATAKPSKAAIPNQSFYPPGYRDLRIAAAAQVATFPRPRDVIAHDFSYAGWKPFYDVIDCSLESIDPNNPDRLMAEYGELALDVARMRSELRKLGYRREIYEVPLLNYERAMITKSQAAHRAPPTETPTSDATTNRYWDLDQDPLRRLAADMERRRKHLQPGKPRFVADGGCGGGESDFQIRLVPPSGQLWLINALAFYVCARRVRDPWNHQACRWTAYSADEEATASGRYMYEARWPDGTVRRGAKILQGDPNSDRPPVITFRKN